MATIAEEEATISLPSLAIVAVLGFFIYRYFFSSRASSDLAGSPSSSAARAGLRFTPQQVEQIAQMFPQLNRRDIMWDLHRNRGSVAATTERVLMGRGLDPAPPSFQPPTSFTTPSSGPVVNIAGASVKPEPDLITRYNLQARVNSKGKERADDLSPASTSAGSTGWSTNKDQRQQMLQRRRDEMILAARRKLQEKDALNATAQPVVGI